VPAVHIVANNTRGTYKLSENLTDDFDKTESISIEDLKHSVECMSERLVVCTGFPARSAVSKG
jgi:hypothetical protein